jgi:hypothetical protein
LAFLLRCSALRHGVDLPKAEEGLAPKISTPHQKCPSSAISQKVENWPAVRCIAEKSNQTYLLELLDRTLVDTTALVD